MHTWDPDRYLTYADERGRPFVELLARVDAADPATVVDLGCGPGNLTALLVERWPGARVVGLDSSAEMIEKARATTPAVDFQRGGPARLGDRRGPGRRPGLQRDAAVGARPPRPAAGPGRPGAPRRLVGLPGARQLRRAEPHDPRRARRAGAVRRAHHRAWRCRARTTRRSTCEALARPRLRGRRVGDDVPPRPRGRGPGVHLGLGHRRAADAPGAARRPPGPLRGGVQAAAAGGVPGS